MIYGDKWFYLKTHKKILYSLILGICILIVSLILVCIVIKNNIESTSLISIEESLEVMEDVDEEILEEKLYQFHDISIPYNSEITTLSKIAHLHNFTVLKTFINKSELYIEIIDELNSEEFEIGRLAILYEDLSNSNFSYNLNLMLCDLNNPELILYIYNKNDIDYAYNSIQRIND